MAGLYKYLRCIYKYSIWLAERVGFEPTVGLTLRLISSQILLANYTPWTTLTYCNHWEL